MTSCYVRHGSSGRAGIYLPWLLKQRLYNICRCGAASVGMFKLSISVYKRFWPAVLVRNALIQARFCFSSHDMMARKNSNMFCCMNRALIGNGRGLKVSTVAIHRFEWRFCARARDVSLRRRLCTRGLPGRASARVAVPACRDGLFFRSASQQNYNITFVPVDGVQNVSLATVPGNDITQL